MKISCINLSVSNVNYWIWKSKYLNNLVRKIMKIWLSSQCCWDFETFSCFIYYGLEVFAYNFQTYKLWNESHTKSFSCVIIHRHLWCLHNESLWKYLKFLSLRISKTITENFACKITRFVYFNKNCDCRWTVAFLATFMTLQLVQMSHDINGCQLSGSILSSLLSMTTFETY